MESAARCEQLNRRDTERWRWAVAGCIPWLVYLAHCCPTIHWRDSPEFVTVGYALGVSHPTGSATYTLLAKAMTLFPLGSVPFRINALSSLCAALAALVCFWTIRMAQDQTKATSGAGVYAPVVALIAALTLAFSRSFWTFAEVAEVYAAQVLWLGLLIAVVLWTARQQSLHSRWRGLLLGAFLYGLGLGVHGFLGCYLPGFVLYLLFTQRRIILQPSQALTMAFFFILGLSVYLLLPLRSAADAFFDWGHTQLWTGFMFHVLDLKDVGTSLNIPHQVHLAHRALAYLQMLPHQVLLGGTVLAAVGCVWQLLRDRATWCLFTVILAVHLGFFLRTWTLELGFLPTFLIVVLWAGIGLAALVEAVVKLTERTRLGPLRTWGGRLTWGAAAVGVALLFIESHPYADKASYRAALRHIRGVFNTIDEGGVLLAKHEWFPSFYVAAVENGRPDVAVLYRRALLLRKRLVAVDPSCLDRLNVRHPAEDEPDAVRLERLLAAWAHRRAVFWEPELDDSLALQMLRPEGLVYRVVCGQPATIGPLQLAAHNTALSSVLRRQAAEPSFFKDEDGLRRYAVLLTALGYFFRERGLPDESARMQSVATDMLPGYYPTLVLKGVLQAERGQSDAAERTFLEAIAASPHLAAARRNLALLYLNSGRYGEAARQWEPLVAQDRNDAEAHYYLGVSYDAMGNATAAREHFQQAQELDPGGEVGSRARGRLGGGDAE